jgi:hypothetical protein
MSLLCAYKYVIGIVQFETVLVPVTCYGVHSAERALYAV